ncbi:MAG: 3-oxoacyl-ACP reductase FabG [Deltaproteobacteria bacterium]|nr:3-oxoacyl-ACP reductase FabG [Deltaproteobacteria bacterium]
MASTVTDKRVVLVTGGSRGIGEAISLSFAANHDTVVINYLSNAGRAKGLVTNIREKGAEAHAICADVSKAEEVNRMIDEVVEKYGRLDVLVNNAGILKGGLLMLLDEKDWDSVIESNLKGVFNCSKAAVRQMISQRSGAIINVSSMSGITGLAGETNYSAAKGGVIAFTKAAAKELAPFGIRVNAVAPGVIATEMINDMPEDIKKRFLDMIPLKRFGAAAEVAGVVRFLASAEASYITGETIIVSGGIP